MIGTQLLNNTNVADGSFMMGFAQGLIVAGLNHAAHMGLNLFGQSKGGPGDPPSLQDMKDNPPKHPGYKSPKSGPSKVRNPNGPGTEWKDKDGEV